MAGKEVRLAVLPGDGIGPEVVAEAVRVLRAAGCLFDVEFSIEEHMVGGASFEACGRPITPAVLAACQEADAVLLGAVGGPQWDTLAPELRPEQALFALRRGLGVFANLRPVKVLPELLPSSPVRPEVAEGTDVMIVRELTGGIYFGEPRRREPAGDDGVRAIDTLVYSTSEIQRILRLAFTLARSRRGSVTSVDKANVLESSRLWRETANKVAAEFPDVTLRHQLVDNTAMQLIRDPRQFDVLVTENMFGDILSDEASVLTGSLGMLPSASLGGRTGFYEPCHGSAPDIAGLGVANPLGTILSAALMLRFSLDLPVAALAIESAVQAVLRAGLRTADLAAPGATRLGTREMGEAVVRALMDQA